MDPETGQEYRWRDVVVFDDGIDPADRERALIHAAGCPRCGEIARGQDSATMAMVQAYVPHEGNLWESMREAVEAFLHDAEAEAEPPQLATPDGDHFCLDIAAQETPPRMAAA